MQDAFAARYDFSALMRYVPPDDPTGSSERRTSIRTQKLRICDQIPVPRLQTEHRHLSRRCSGRRKIPIYLCYTSCAIRCLAVSVALSNAQTTR